MEMSSWNFNWYVSPDNLAKVHSTFFNLDLRFLLQFSCIPLLDCTPGIKTYSWEISFLNLTQRTSSKFCPKIFVLLWSQRETCQVRSSIVLSTAGKKPVYKHFCDFMLGQLKKTDWLSGLGCWKTLAIYQVGGFFLLSGGMNISRGNEYFSVAGVAEIDLLTKAFILYWNTILEIHAPSLSHCVLIATCRCKFLWVVYFNVAFLLPPCRQYFEGRLSPRKNAGGAF